LKLQNSSEVPELQNRTAYEFKKEFGTVRGERSSYQFFTKADCRQQRPIRPLNVRNICGKIDFPPITAFNFQVLRDM